MKTDISHLSIEQLKALQAEADDLIETKTEQAIIDAYQKVNEIAANVGFKIEELLKIGAEKTKKKSRKSVEPRYRNKNNPEETWTGRGKQPRWLVLELEKPGAKLENFLI